MRNVPEIYQNRKNDHLDIQNKIYSNVYELIELRNNYLNNPIIGYLNINSLRNKIIGLREIMSKAPLKIFCIDETKLDKNFLDFQFHIENNQFSLISKRSKVSETICIGFTIPKKNWFILFAYKTPKQNYVSFFEEVSNSLNRPLNKYGNIFLSGDLNIDLLDSKCDPNNHFSVLRDMYMTLQVL